MNKTLLVADSGSTKTDWLLGDLHLQTQGINPIHQTDETISAILRDELLPQLSGGGEEVESVEFYGSGVRPDQEDKMVRLLRECFHKAIAIEAHSDLLGAARALCGNSEGIACILGTGANSCLYDGQRIVLNTPALGYILGDEGSGAVLGIRFINALYKNRLGTQLVDDFEATLQMRLSDVIDRVYRQPLANRWLASLSPFIHSHLDVPGVEAIVVDNFRDFIRRNIVPYQRPDLPIQAVGSIAHYYRPQLAEAVCAEGFTLGKVMRSPLEDFNSE
ncbi:MAG: ATPase [Prevotella sp.]|nr:ATPase [Prevotella sp.]